MIHEQYPGPQGILHNAVNGDEVVMPELGQNPPLMCDLAIIMTG